MEREACVCDHGFERSDLCAEIINNTNNSSFCRYQVSRETKNRWRHVSGRGIVPPKYEELLQSDYRTTSTDIWYIVYSFTA